MDQETRVLELLHSATSSRRAAARLTLRMRDGASAVGLTCTTEPPTAAKGEPQSKVRFDLGRLDAQGLLCPADTSGIRARVRTTPEARC